MTDQQQYEIEMAEGKHPKAKAMRFLKAFFKFARNIR